jgi:GDPmannose 4,6-dehydratase
MAKRRALIFGISGQDGAYLAQWLLKKGYQVDGTSRDAATADFGRLKSLGLGAQVRLHSVVLSDFRSVHEVLKATRPQEAYNLSGQSSVGLSFSQPMETFESITLGGLNILEALRLIKGRTRFYNASSGDCFGDTGGKKADESAAFRPHSPYGVAKAAAFWAVANYRQAYGLHASSGLLFNHESPLRPERFVTRKVVAAAARIARGSREKLALGDLSIRRDWGWAPDYVQAMWAMLQRPRGGDYVIATGRNHSLQEFVAAAFACFGLDWRAHVKIDRRFFRPDEIRSNCGNAGKARRDLGWKAALDMSGVVERMAEAERLA